MSFYDTEFDWIGQEARMYDPSLGRFLSAVPKLQNPTSVQGHNRYSYVLNNPLKYTDPSGYKVKPAGWDAPWEYSAYVNFGPKGGSLSGNYWAVDYRTTEGNWAAMSQSTFDNLYGAGKYTDCYEDIRLNLAISMAAPGDFTTYSWNPYGGREILRENTENGVNIYYEGSLSWISNGKYPGREYRRSDDSGPEGYDVMDYVNAFVGAAGSYFGLKGNMFHNELYWVQKNGTLRSTQILNNSNKIYRTSYNVVKESFAIAKVWSNRMATLGLVTTGIDIAVDGQIRPSHMVNLTMAGISYTGVGSLVSGAYWITDTGFEVFTGYSLGDRLDQWLDPQRGASGSW